MLTNETLKVIKERRSIRSYKKEQIKDEELEAVLEAGLYAPNAGDQAWHFTVIQKKEVSAMTLPILYEKSPLLILPIFSEDSIVDRLIPNLCEILYSVSPG